MTKTEKMINDLIGAAKILGTKTFQEALESVLKVYKEEQGD